jgi:hypothetical protein
MLDFRCAILVLFVLIQKWRIAMNKKELLKKVKANEGLTVEEIIEYQKIVKPVKHVYGKYGNLALVYLKEHNVGKYWSLAGSLPEYLHNVDKHADRLYMTMYNKLSKSERFKKTGDFIKDLQMETEKQKLIEEEILTELVYVD